MASDIGQEQLQAVARARRLVGLPHHVLLRDLRCRLLVGLGFAHLEADALELARQLLDVDVCEFVLEGECLEFGRFDPAALLAHVEHGAGAFGFEKFGQLILRQVLWHIPSLLTGSGNLRTVWDFSSVCQGLPTFSRPNHSIERRGRPPATDVRWGIKYGRVLMMKVRANR